ncbi:MAG: HNH endonuclease [Dehalococcoidales bacterium]|nr:HNH endonuclease [Dehalococcoidales bacterium]
MNRQQVKWYCHSCGYEWEGARFRRQGVRKCPSCGGTTLTPGTEDKSWKDIRLEIRKRDRFACQICGAQKGQNLALAVHHMRPVGHGGSSKPDNLILLCAKCHNWEHRLLRLGMKAEYTRAGIPPLIYFIIVLLFVIVPAVFLLWFALIPLVVLLSSFTAYLLYRRRLKKIRVKQLRLNLL